MPVNPPRPNAGREISRAERRGVSATDTTAASPLGVGKSLTRRAEDYARRKSERGHVHLGSKGESQRPHGKATSERSFGSVEPIHPESPGLHAGDQGG